MASRTCLRCGQQFEQLRGRPRSMDETCRAADRAEYWRKRARAKREAARHAAETVGVRDSRPPDGSTPESERAVDSALHELADLIGDPRWRADAVSFAHWLQVRISLRRLALSPEDEGYAGELSALARHSSLAAAVFHTATGNAWQTDDPWWPGPHSQEPDEDPHAGDR